MCDLLFSYSLCKWEVWMWCLKKVFVETRVFYVHIFSKIVKSRLNLHEFMEESTFKWVSLGKWLMDSSMLQFVVNLHQRVVPFSSKFIHIRFSFLQLWCHQNRKKWHIFLMGQLSFHLMDQIESSSKFKNDEIDVGKKPDFVDAQKVLWVRLTQACFIVVNSS